MPNIAAIELQAKTDQFEAKLKRALGTFDNLIQKGYSVSKSLDGSFKTISKSAGKTATDIEKAFNTLQLKSDIDLQAQAATLTQSEKVFKQAYLKIKMDAKSSAREIEQAFVNMQIKLRQIANETVPLSLYDIDYNEALAAKEKFNQAKLASDKAAIYSRLKLIQETNSLEKGFENMRLEAAEAAIKLKKDEENAARKLLGIEEKRVRALQQLKASEQASYAQQAMTGEASAARLVGQLQAGTGFAKQLRSQMEEVPKPIEKATKNMNLFNLASIASIAKIQILFTIVNNTLGAISQMPGLAMQSVEAYQSAAISNAALITSMQVGVKDIGKAYQENKIYAEQVQDVLIKMDAQTAASGQNLTDMNRKFVEQGILIDVNNKKQIDGFLNIANALAALTSGDANANLQWPQEVSALLRGENKETNKLFKLLNNLDNGNLKEHLALWKETGTTIVNLGALLVGFKAAQGDINALWETAKSTMETIRDEVLRKGFAPEFELIVNKMRELGEYADENGDKIAAMMQAGFADLNSIAAGLFKVVGFVKDISEPLLWVGITAGIYGAGTAMAAFASSVTVASGGINLLLAGLASLSLYGYTKYKTNVALDERAAKISTTEGFTGETLSDILEKYPLATDDQIKEWINLGAISVIKHQNPMGANAPASYSTLLKEASIAQLIDMRRLEKAASVPKVTVGARDDEEVFKKQIDLRKKQFEAERSYSQISLETAKQEAALKLQLADNQYKNLEIGQKEYLQQKHAAEITAANNEIVEKKRILNEANALLGESVKSPIDDKAKEAELVVKVNKATQDLIKSKGELKTLEARQTGENTAANLAQIKLVNDVTRSEIGLKEKLIANERAYYRLTSGQAAEATIDVLNDRLRLEQTELALINQSTSEGQLQYNQKLAQIQEINFQIEQQNKLIRDQTAIGGMINAMNEYKDVGLNTGRQIQNAFTNAFTKIEDSLYNLVRNGKLSFSGLADSIIGDISRIIAKQVQSGIFSSASEQTAGSLGNLALASSGSGIDNSLILAGGTALKEWFNPGSYTAGQTSLQSGVASLLENLGAGSVGAYTSTGLTSAASLEANFGAGGTLGSGAAGNVSGLSSSAMGAWTAGFGTFIMDLLSGKEFVNAAAEGLGAAGGAYAGAAIGSVIPVIGTAIGGILGGALGALGMGSLFGGGESEPRYRPSLLNNLTDDTWSRSGGFDLPQADPDPYGHYSYGAANQALIAYTSGVGQMQTTFAEQVNAMRDQMSETAWNAFATALEQQDFTDTTGDSKIKVENAADETTRYLTEYAAKLQAGLNEALAAALPVIAEELTGSSSAFAMLTDAMQEAITGAIHGGSFGQAEFGQLTSYLNQIATATAPIQEIIDTHGLSEYELSLRSINQQFDAYGQQLKNAGIDLEKYTDFEKAKAWAIEEVNAANEKALTNAALDAATTDLNNSFAEERNKLTEQHTSLLSDYNDNLKSVNSTISDLSKYVNSVHSARISMNDGSMSLSASQFQSATYTVSEVLKDLRSGDFSTLSNLDDSLNVVAKPTRELYASFQDYSKDYWKSYSSLSEIENLTGNQLTLEEQAANNFQNLIDVENEMYATQTQQLTDQLNALLGINQNILGLQQAIGNYTTAKVNNVIAEQATGSDQKSQVEALYAAYGWTPDAAGVQYWLNDLANGQSISDVAKSFNMISGSFASGTDYVPYDMTARIHKGERITPAAYNRNDSTNSRLVDIFSSMKSIMTASYAAIAKSTNKTSKIIQRWDINGMPQTSTI